MWHSLMTRTESYHSLKRKARHSKKTSILHLRMTFHEHWNPHSMLLGNGPLLRATPAGCVMSSKSLRNLLCRSLFLVFARQRQNQLKGKLGQIAKQCFELFVRLQALDVKRQ